MAIAIESKASLSVGLTNAILSSRDSLYCLGYTLPNNVSVFMCYVMLPAFLDVTSKDFCHSSAVLGLMSGPTAICLWLHHETYFAEMFTPGTYNN